MNFGYYVYFGQLYLVFEIHSILCGTILFPRNKNIFIYLLFVQLLLLSLLRGYLKNV